MTTRATRSSTAAFEGRRQGPVRQGARDRARGRPRRPRGAFAQGRADGPAAGFALAAVLEREDPRDAFVSNAYAALDALPRGAHASAPRACAAQAQLRERCGPTCAIEPLRGNVDTRLRKLDGGEIRRHRARRRGADAPRPRRAHPRAARHRGRCLPAPGQGALGIECAADAAALRDRLAALTHAPTCARRCAPSARSVARARRQLQLPLAAYAVMNAARAGSIGARRLRRRAAHRARREPGARIRKASARPSRGRCKSRRRSDLRHSDELRRGRGIVVTRPRELAQPLAEAIGAARRAGDPVPGDRDRGAAGARRAAAEPDYQLAIFVSPTAVRMAMRADGGWPADVRRRGDRRAARGASSSAPGSAA